MTGITKYKISNEQCQNVHGHGKFPPNSVEFCFHNFIDWQWGKGYNHCSDSSLENEYEIEHLRNRHITNKQYCMGHGEGKTKPDQEQWFKFSEKVEGRKGWYYMDSGVKVDKKNVPQKYIDIMKRWEESVQNRIHA